MRHEDHSKTNLTKCRTLNINLMHSFHSLIRTWNNPDNFFSPKLRNNLASLCPSKSPLHGENRCFPVTRSTVSSHQQPSASKQAQTRPGSDQHAEQQGENYVFFFPPSSAAMVSHKVVLDDLFPYTPQPLTPLLRRSKVKEQCIVLLWIAELQSVLNELKIRKEVAALPQ